jgi:hypothetical protein
VVDQRGQWCAVNNLASQKTPVHQLGIRDLPGLLMRLVRRPIEFMREPISLSWRATITLQTSAAIVSSAYIALLEKNTLNFLIGIFVLPVLIIMIGAIFTLVIYYYFALFTSTYLDIRRLHALITIATLPYFLLHSFSGFLPPLDVVGFSLSAILCVVGLVEQFSLRRRMVLSLLSTTTVLFVLIWSIAQYFMSLN